MEIINQIISWPVLVQGALGSGLFWLFMKAGQYVSNISKNFIGSHKKDMLARDKLIEKAIKSSSLQEWINFSSLAVYISLHYIIKAIIFISLGVMLKDYIPVFSIIGYIGGIGYLFLALRYSPHLDSHIEKYKAEKENNK